MAVVRAAQVSTRIRASKDTVWRALTTPALLKQYFMGADVDSSFQVGAPIQFMGNFQGKAYHDRGVIREARPSEALVFTHWSELSGAPETEENHHLIRIELRDLDDTTLVTLSQDNLDGKAVSTKNKEAFEKNWTGVLNGLKKTAESKAARQG